MILHRYYSLRLTKLSFSVLFTLFGLYALIDYTSRTSSLCLPFSDLGSYYLYTFISRLDILAPFALLIAVITTLCQSNLKQELVAMQAAGISFTQLLSPFIWLGLFVTASIYLSTQFLVPLSMSWIMQAEDIRILQSHQNVHKMSLRDGSRLLYLHYDRIHGHFIKSYWIRSLDDIYRIQILKIESKPAVGYTVEHLKRDRNGALIPSSYHEEIELPLAFYAEEIVETTTLPSERSLTQLWVKLFKRHLSGYERAQVEASLYKKLVMPWLCFIALIGPIPYCIRYKRPLKIFQVFAGSLLALFLLFVLLSVGFTFTQNQLLPPFFALLLPTMAAVFIVSWRFYFLDYHQRSSFCFCSFKTSISNAFFSRS